LLIAIKVFCSQNSANSNLNIMLRLLAIFSEKKAPKRNRILRFLYVPVMTNFFEHVDRIDFFDED